MDRRSFLKSGAFLTVAAATAGGLAACGDGDDDTLAGTFAFGEGVASGDPRPDSVMLWTRVVRSDGVAAEVRASLQVATDAGFANVAVMAVAVASPEFDNTIRVKVTGLAPGTNYYYRFLAGADRSTAGRTRTAPAPGTAPGTLRFACITCQDYTANHWQAFEALVAEDLDFVVHLGDYVYETVGAAFQQGAAEPAHKALQLPDGTPTPNAAGSVSATTLRDYRHLYRTYRSDPRLQALHARFPMIAIWDDHEFTNDCWQGHETYTNANTVQTARRRAATQAWFEYIPTDVPFDPAASGVDTIRIYRDFQFGTLAHLVMTDERLYRSDHVIDELAVAPALGKPVNPGADDQIGSRYLVDRAAYDAVEAQRLAAGQQVTMLGETQENWLRAKLSTSPAVWKLWGNEVSLLRMQLDLRAIAPTPFNKVFLLNCDQWDGYNAARKRLTGFIRDTGIENVVALTGDLHAFFAGQVFDDYDSAAPKPVMVDITTAGISSTPFFYEFYDYAKNDPTYKLLAPLVYVDGPDGALINTFDATLRQFNPWLKVVDTRVLGYMIVTVTADKLVVQQKRFRELNADGTPPPAVPTGVTTITVAAGATAMTVQQG